MDIFWQGAQSAIGDISLFLIFVAIAIGVGVFFGRTKLLSIMIDVYIARALVAVIPGKWIALTDYQDIIIFSIVFGVLFLTDQRLFDIHLSNRGSDFFWRLVVMSVLVSGMLVSTLLSLLPQKEVLGVISQTAYGYFTNPFFAVLWMTLPLLILLFINRRLRD